MTDTAATATTGPRPKAQWPSVRPVETGDILDAIEAGLRDFKAAPQFGLFF